jgi:osmotically-inducible protein OsmY
MKSNESLQLKVANQLKKDPLLKDASIVVEICNRQAIVSGKVNKYFKKAMVCKLVKEVTEIINVVDHIEVSLLNGVHFSDEAITNAILEKFEKNLGCSYKNINLSVNDGHVVLEGPLKWQYQKLLATDCITYIEGIISIQNNITTGAAQEPLISEKDILAAIYKEELITSDINVDLNGRKVILTGNVSSSFQKKLVEKIVSELPGIKEIESKLVIQK